MDDPAMPRAAVWAHPELTLLGVTGHEAELARAGFLDLRGQRGFLGRLHQVYWWAVVVIVLLIPTRPDELTFYFPAVLAIAAAWLFAMPAYAQGPVASSADFSALLAEPQPSP